MTYNVLCLLAKYVVGDKHKHKHKQVTFQALGIGHWGLQAALMTIFHKFSFTAYQRIDSKKWKHYRCYLMNYAKPNQN